MKILPLLLLLTSAACADVSGFGATRCGSTFVVYSNTDTTAPITFDFSFWIQNSPCGATVTWTDAAGIQQSLVVPFDLSGNSSRGARITLPPAGASPSPVTVTLDASPGNTTQYNWHVERVS